MAETPATARATHALGGTTGGLRLARQNLDTGLGARPEVGRGSFLVFLPERPATAARRWPPGEPSPPADRFDPRAHRCRFEFFAPLRLQLLGLACQRNGSHTGVVPFGSRLVSPRGLVALLALLPALGGSPDSKSGFSFDDWLVAPVRVHLLTASNAPAVHTTLTETDVHHILNKMNGIWAQAGISFWLESLVRERALPCSTKLDEPDDLQGLLALRPEGTKATNLFHLYYVKRFSANGVYLGEAMFVKDTASLRTVDGGIDEPLPRVSSHEIGHAFTLQHCANEQHLMFRGTTGTNLDEVEISQAREAAQKLTWIMSAPAMWKNAAQASRARQTVEARRLYSQLATIPLDEPPVRIARQRTGGF